MRSYNHGVGGVRRGRAAGDSSGRLPPSTTLQAATSSSTTVPTQEVRRNDQIPSLKSEIIWWGMLGLGWAFDGVGGGRRLVGAAAGSLRDGHDCSSFFFVVFLKHDEASGGASGRRMPNARKGSLRLLRCDIEPAKQFCFSISKSA
ncbi:hypothetical protein Salat_0586500 [Sesamum alatum]|uniref:Uncharacterized protein n=1 Tax=Sesamum alatum TaxID=300844 RepID=A0AAE2CTU3_9LAMI|nr:hypothetical protein Salat_0586500 [Sesamum alatum]